MSSDIRGANQPAAHMQDPYGELKLVSVRLDSHAFRHAADLCEARRRAELQRVLRIAPRAVTKKRVPRLGHELLNKCTSRVSLSRVSKPVNHDAPSVITPIVYCM